MASIGADQQTSPGHFYWLFYSQQIQNCRRDILERASVAQFPSEPRIAKDERDRGGGVRGVWTAGLGVDHLLAIPVVGGDDSRALDSLD